MGTPWRHVDPNAVVFLEAPPPPRQLGDADGGHHSWLTSAPLHRPSHESTDVRTLSKALSIPARKQQLLVKRTSLSRHRQAYLRARDVGLDERKYISAHTVEPHFHAYVMEVPRMQHDMQPPGP